MSFSLTLTCFQTFWRSNKKKSISLKYFYPQVEFEARGPEEEDFHGIRRLLQQLFLKTPSVDVGKVTEAILGTLAFFLLGRFSFFLFPVFLIFCLFFSCAGQKYLGSVIKQTQLDDADEDEEDEEDPNEVYAVSTVLGLSEKQKPSVSGIRWATLYFLKTFADVQYFRSPDS